MNGTKRTIGHATLAALWLVTLAGVAGFAVFGARPGMLVRFPDAVPVYAAMYRWMPIAQVVMSFAAMALLLWLCVGWRWLTAFAALYAVSLGSELAGTTWGVPFGEYGYGEGLGVKWLGRVPVTIPLSWFYMALPAYALIARWSAGARRVGVARRVVLGAALLTAWDLALDPAMSAATTFWWWGESGAYYGMPWVNLVGWFATGVVLMALLRGLDADRWLADVPSGWMASFYGANLLMAAGMAAGASMWGAVATTAIALIGIVLAARWPAWRSPEGSTITRAGSAPESRPGGRRLAAAERGR